MRKAPSRSHIEVAVILGMAQLAMGTLQATTFTSRDAFFENVTPEWHWGFEGYSGGTQFHDERGPGPVTVVTANLNPLPVEIAVPASLSGNVIYFNGGDDARFRFESGVYAFGITSMWTSQVWSGSLAVYVPVTLRLSAYDIDGVFIDSITASVGTAISGPYQAWNYYESFFGFITNKPIYRIDEEEYLGVERGGGAAFFDNVTYGSIQGVPEGPCGLILLVFPALLAFHRRFVR